MSKNDLFAKYFNAHAQRNGICYYDPIVKASPVKQGDQCELVMNGVKSRETAIEDGYVVAIQGDVLFYNTARFNLTFSRIDEWLSRTNRSSLPENTMAFPVEKGQEIKVHMLERATQATMTTAPSDGWVVNSYAEGKARFMTDLVFRSMYKTDLALPDSQKNIYRYKTLNTDLPVSYVRLDRDIHYRDSMNIPHIAYAGDMLLALPSLPRDYSEVAIDMFYSSFAVERPSPMKAEPAKIIPFKKRTP